TGSAVAVEQHGNVVIMGASQTMQTDMDIFTAMLRGADGAILWEQQYAGPAGGYDYGAALRIDQAGHVLIAGSSYEGRNLDFYLASYAREDGTLRWEMSYHGAFNRDNYVSFSNGLATGPDGMIAIAGTTSGYDLATLVFQ